MVIAHSIRNRETEAQTAELIFPKLFNNFVEEEPKPKSH